MARCQAIKPNGERCKGDASPGADWCYSHDPAHAEQRRRNASRGGRSGGRGRPATDLADIKREIRDVVDSVLTGRIDKGRGAVGFQGYNCLLKAVEIERKVRETTELEERLTALERNANKPGGKTTWRQA